MLLAAALAFMTVAVIAAIALPLLRGARGGATRGAFDRAVYRDQLRELERDVTRGLIEPQEAASARLEIERRLLATDNDDTAPTASPRAGSPALAIALAVTLPAAAALIYIVLGAPGVPDQPYADREPERALARAGGDNSDKEKAVATLEAKLKLNPNSDADWLLLARTEAALGHWQKSADAYRQALRLTQGRADILSGYGEMLAMAADGVITPAAHDAFTAALVRDPKEEAARYYLALGEAQAGNAAAAIEGWQKLAADLPAGSPLRSELKTRIADAARAGGLPVPELAAPQPGPSAADMANAAKMTPEERQQMIRGMVEKLAAELEAKPDDPQGWLRLGRAYAVLGEREKSADAYARAEKLRPDDADVLLAEAEAILPHDGPQVPLPEQAVALLQRVEKIDPKRPAALWYLGLAAAQQRHFAEASDYWQRLLAELPESSEQHQAVAAAIDALKGK